MDICVGKAGVEEDEFRGIYSIIQTLSIHFTYNLSIMLIFS